MAYMNQKKLIGIPLFVDFEKAFDTIEWSFKIKLLERFNFSQGLIQWIKTFYCKMSTLFTRVLVDLAYKPTPLFVVHFQVFKVFYNLVFIVFTSLAVCADQPNIKMLEYSDVTFSKKRS